MSDTKTFDSLIVNGLKVDIANYLTEQIIINYCTWQKRQVPTFAFWRKEFTEENPSLKDLTKRYVAELSGVRDLLAVFTPSIVAKYIKDKRLIGVRLVKKDTQKGIAFDLLNRQTDWNRNLAKEFKIKIADLERSDDKSKFMGTIRFTNKTTGMSL